MFRRVLRRAVGIAVRQFPQTAHRLAAFISYQLELATFAQSRAKSERVTEARQAMPTASAPRPTPSRTEQQSPPAESYLQALWDVLQEQIGHIPEDTLKSIAARGLLTEHALHKCLAALIEARKFDELKRIANDPELGFDIVRDYHRIRLASHLCDPSVSFEDVADLHRRACGSFLRAATLDLLIIEAVKAGRVNHIARVLVDMDDNDERRVADTAFLGACRLLVKERRYEVAARVLERRMGRIDEAQQLYYQRLGSAYAAYDDADRDRFNRLVITPLSTLPRGDRNLMDVRFSPQQRKALIEKIRTSLFERRPLSLVRLGDAEAYAYTSPVFDWLDPTLFDRDNALREQHWWGAAPSPSCRAEIRDAVRRAVDRCDVLGLPSVYRVVFSLCPPITPYGASYQQRGLLMVLDAGIRAAEVDGKMLTEERCHLCALNAAVLADLAREADSVILVSCWSEDQLRFPAESARYLTVPPHQNVRHLARPGRTQPIFETYQDTAVHLRAEAKPGTLVLVGAGIVGKILIDEAKSAGAVAIDVGSLLDYMAGYQLAALPI